MVYGLSLHGREIGVPEVYNIDEIFFEEIQIL